MAKASMTLPNGTVVQIEGTADEVRNLLHFYAADTGQSQGQPRNAASPSPKRKQSKPPSQLRAGHRPSESAPNLSEIVNLAKNCDEAEKIERQILDRASQVDRTLLPLYLVHEHLENAFGLSSGDISKITTDLGVPVSTPNASTTLSVMLCATSFPAEVCNICKP
jgi:hypothetical protein